MKPPGPKKSTFDKKNELLIFVRICWCLYIISNQETVKKCSYSEK